MLISLLFVPVESHPRVLSLDRINCKYFRVNYKNRYFRVWRSEGSRAGMGNQNFWNNFSAKLALSKLYEGRVGVGGRVGVVWLAFTGNLGLQPCLGLSGLKVCGGSVGGWRLCANLFHLSGHRPQPI